MICKTVKLPGGGVAIACGSRPRVKKCVACQRPGLLLCDWKMPGGKTCDRPICADHADHVAEDKDLCPAHQQAYREWLAARVIPPPR